MKLGEYRAYTFDLGQPPVARSARPAVMAKARAKKFQIGLYGAVTVAIAAPIFAVCPAVVARDSGTDPVAKVGGEGRPKAFEPGCSHTVPNPVIHIDGPKVC